MSDLDLKDIKWPQISRNQWEEKLKKELKTEDLSSKTITLEPSIIYDPFKNNVSFDKQEITHFPKLSYAQKFGLQSDESLNKAILHLLQNDLSVINFKANESTNWDAVLKDILPELIHMNILFENSQAKKKFDAYRNSQKEGQNWSVSCGHEHLSTDETEELIYTNLPGLSQVELIKCALWDIGKLKSNKILVSFNVNENLLEIIPFARALRIAFSSKYPDKQLQLAAHCPLHELCENKNDELIRAGSVFLFCSMAGFDHLYLSTLTRESELDHARLLLNVQNIFSLESQIDDVKDPLSGSFIIEDLTRQFLKASV